MIYLDNAATTPLSENAAKEFVKYSCSDFFNPSATYVQAVEIKNKLSEVRENLKNLLGARKGDIVFTGGATEANNLAILGSAREGKWEYIFSAGEHASVIELAHALEKEGKTISIIPLQKTGEIDYVALEKALTPKTRLVSVMFVNNVTGAINDIARVSRIMRKKSPTALLHVDGVQAFGKLEFSLDRLDVDLFSISAHKFHGPKGVGALYVKNKAALKNIVFGGGQEFGVRSGTENVAGIMAMNEAANEMKPRQNFEKVSNLKGIFMKELESVKGIRFVGENTSPYILLMIFSGINGETLVRVLENEVVVGRGSACSSKKSGNHVLEAMGIRLEDIKGAVRASFDPMQAEEEILKAARIIKERYLELLERLK